MSMSIRNVIKFVIKILSFSFLFLTASLSFSFGLEVDLSRRQKQGLTLQRGDSISEDEHNVIEKVMGSFVESNQPIALLHGDTGFIPSTITVKVGMSYKFHVVNVSEKNRNVSLVFDDFSQNHGLYFGKMKTFELAPRVSGIFHFKCPETGATGRLVVIPKEEKNLSMVSSK